MKKIIFFILAFFCVNLFSQTERQANPKAKPIHHKAALPALGECGEMGSYCYEDFESIGNDLIVFCPEDTTQLIELNIVALELFNGDHMFIYDGPDENSPLIAQYDGGMPSTDFFNQTIVSSQKGNCISVDFESNFIQSCTNPGNGISNPNPFIYIAECACDIVSTAIFETSGTQFCYSSSDNSVEIEFDGSMSFSLAGQPITEYVWDFGDGNIVSTTNPVYVHTFLNPGSYNVSLNVLVNDCSSEMFYETIQISGPPTITTFANNNGPYCPDQNFSLFALAESYSWSPGPIEFMNDTTIINAPSEVFDVITVSNYSGAIGGSANISIYVDIQHDWVTDLQMFIICPDGSSVPLLDFPNFTTSVDVDGIYTFNNEGTTTLENAIFSTPANQVVPPGIYLPLAPFSNLEGCSINGDWTLLIFDTFAGGEPISLDSWGISFLENVASPPFESLIIDANWSGNGLTQSGSILEGNVPLEDGFYDYILTLTDEFGCNFYDTTTIEVGIPNIDDGCALTVDSLDVANCLVINTPPLCDDGDSTTLDFFDFDNCMCQYTTEILLGCTHPCALNYDDTANTDDGNCIFPICDDACPLTNDTLNLNICQCIFIVPVTDDGCDLTADSFDINNCLIINEPPNVDDGCILTADSFDLNNCIVINQAPNIDDGCELTMDSFDYNNCEIVNIPDPELMDDNCELTSDSFDADNCLVINTQPDCDDQDENTLDSFDVENCLCINESGNSIEIITFDINIAPNPNKGIFYVLGLNEINIKNTTIVNQLGQTIPFQSKHFRNSIQVKMDIVASGIYLLKINITDNKSIIKKILVTN